MSSMGTQDHLAEAQLLLDASEHPSMSRSSRDEQLSKASVTMEAEEVENTNKLIKWSELEPWQRDNEFILTAYREPSYSYSKSISSLLQAHNESFNIWSHLIASAVFIVALFFVLQNVPRWPQHVPTADTLALLTFFVCTICCFIFSMSHHLLLDHSEHINHLTARFDHLGIILPLWGTTVASTHFGFYCSPHLQSFYWYLATVSASLCGLATFHPMFRTPAGRQIRVLLYVLLGASSFLPVAEGVKLNGYAEHNHRMGLSYFIGLGLFHGTGAAIYGARMPERFWPGRFDILGSSHQIMHALVVCGAVCYSYGLMKAFWYWNGMTDDGVDVCKLIQ